MYTNAYAIYLREIALAVPAWGVLGWVSGTAGAMVRGGSLLANAVVSSAGSAAANLAVSCTCFPLTAMFWVLYRLTQSTYPAMESSYVRGIETLVTAMYILGGISGPAFFRWYLDMGDIAIYVYTQAAVVVFATLADVCMS